MKKEAYGSDAFWRKGDNDGGVPPLGAGHAHWFAPKQKAVYVFGGNIEAEFDSRSNVLGSVSVEKSPRGSRHGPYLPTTRHSDAFAPGALHPAARGEIRAALCADEDHVVIPCGYGNFRFYGMPYFATTLLYRMSTNTFQVFLTSGLSDRARVCPVILPPSCFAGPQGGVPHTDGSDDGEWEDDGSHDADDEAAESAARGRSIGTLLLCGGYIGGATLQATPEIVQIALPPVDDATGELLGERPTSLHSFEERFPEAEPPKSPAVTVGTDKVGGRAQEFVSALSAPPPFNAEQAAMARELNRRCPPYFQLHDSDVMAFRMSDAFWNPVEDFTPHEDVKSHPTGQRRRYAWGQADNLEEVNRDAECSDDDVILQVQGRMMRTSYLQSMYPPPQLPPEASWLRELARHWGVPLGDKKPDAARRAACGRRTGLFRIELTKSEYPLVRLPEGRRVWRTFTCPLDMTLAAFAHRVLTPVMGWRPRYHAHVYTHLATGAVFGPTEETFGQGSPIDLMHKPNSNMGVFLNEKNVLLGELLKNRGEELMYVYDLGDIFHHTVTLERLVLHGSNDDTPTGAIVLDGALACPPEDSNQSYVNALAAKKAGSTDFSSCKAVYRQQAHHAGVTDPTAFSCDERNAAHATLAG